MRPSNSALKLLRLRIKHGSRALAISSCHLMGLCRREEYFSSAVWAQMGGVKPSDVASIADDIFEVHSAPPPADSLKD